MPNTHYYGRAADIRRGNGTDPDILDVGRTIAGIPPQQRPDRIIGSRDWTEALDHSRGEGWILEEDQLALHEDHLHLGYTSEEEP